MKRFSSDHGEKTRVRGRLNGHEHMGFVLGPFASERNESDLIRGRLKSPFLFGADITNSVRLFISVFIALSAD